MFFYSSIYGVGGSFYFQLVSGHACCNIWTQELYDLNFFLVTFLWS